MLQAVHEGGLHLHAAVLVHHLGDVVLQQSLHHPPLGVVPEVARVRSRLVVHQLQAPHEVHVGGRTVNCPVLGVLVSAELAELLVALEVEVVELPEPAVQVHDVPVAP